MTLLIQEPEEIYTTAAGLEFYQRLGTSDIKTILEVVTKKGYFRREFKVEPDETWIDLGANIGAFTVLTAASGAMVTAYEPDPDSFALLKKNVALNSAKMKYPPLLLNSAATTESKKALLHVSRTRQYWRNSLVKDWHGDTVPVDCVNFDVIDPQWCIKMDIEGSEMELLEKRFNQRCKKLVFEWSFDVDPSLARFYAVIKKLKGIYGTVKHRSIAQGYEFWQKSWFPPCTMVWCY